MSETFANRLKELIELRHLQQKELAILCALSPARLSAYIRNRSEPPLCILTDICQHLGCTADYLLGLSDTIAPTAPITIAPAIITTDPLSDLLPEYKRQAETYIQFLRQQQAAQPTHRDEA